MTTEQHHLQESIIHSSWCEASPLGRDNLEPTPVDGLAGLAGLAA